MNVDESKSIAPATVISEIKEPKIDSVNYINSISKQLKDLLSDNKIALEKRAEVIQVHSTVMVQSLWRNPG